jgi:hypothetical protein
LPVTVCERSTSTISSSSSANVQLRLIKCGGHYLSEPHEIDAILAELDELIVLVDPSQTITGKLATEPAGDGRNSN